jgi:hypothetical protein
MKDMGDDTVRVIVVDPERGRVEARRLPRSEIEHDGDNDVWDTIHDGEVLQVDAIHDGHRHYWYHGEDPEAIHGVSVFVGRDPATGAYRDSTLPVEDVRRAVHERPQTGEEDVLTGLLRVNAELQRLTGATPGFRDVFGYAAIGGPPAPGPVQVPRPQAPAPDRVAALREMLPQLAAEPAREPAPAPAAPAERPLQPYIGGSAADPY